MATGFVKNKQFDLHFINGKYTVRYSFEEISNGTKLTCSEDNCVSGSIDGPLTMENMEKLKNLIESN